MKTKPNKSSQKSVAPIVRNSIFNRKINRKKVRHASRILGFLSWFKPAWSLIWWSQYICTVVSGGGGKGCKRKVKHRLYNPPAVKRRFPEYHVVSNRIERFFTEWELPLQLGGDWGMEGGRPHFDGRLLSYEFLSILISSWKRILGVTGKRFSANLSIFF